MSFQGRKRARTVIDYDRDTKTITFAREPWYLRFWYWIRYTMKQYIKPFSLILLGIIIGVITGGDNPLMCWLAWHTSSFTRFFMLDSTVADIIVWSCL